MKNQLAIKGFIVCTLPFLLISCVPTQATIIPPVTQNPTNTLTVGAVPSLRPTEMVTFTPTLTPSIAASSTDIPTSTLSPTLTPDVTTQEIFQNGEFRNTTAKDFTFRVAKVELTPNGKMRWYFEFWNKSDKAVLFGLNYSNTVLADEFGNKYDVLDASTYPNKLFEESVAAGVLYNLWIDFNSPISNSKKFIVTLAPANSYWHPHYGLFDLDVNYDASSIPPPSTATLSPNSSVLFENGDFQNSSSPDFIFRVARVDLLSNDKMRWYFEFWNKSDKPVLFGLNHSNITLADENGHQYAALDGSTYPNKLFEITIAAGVLYNHWIEFDAPVNGSKTFKVTLAPANVYWHPHYDVFTLTFK